MKTYEVHFTWNGKVYQEVINCNSSIKARELIRGRYSGARVISVRQA